VSVVYGQDGNPPSPTIGDPLELPLDDDPLLEDGLPLDPLDDEPEEPLDGAPEDPLDDDPPDDDPPAAASEPPGAPLLPGFVPPSPLDPAPEPPPLPDPPDDEPGPPVVVSLLHRANTTIEPMTSTSEAIP
jgi:hypothetical protein